MKLSRYAFWLPAAALAVLASTVAGAESREAPRPNIIVIMSDDMGYSDIGCYGSEIETPHLDRLAADGLRFTQFYNTARCCPTRASLLSGLYQHQAGIGWMTSENARNSNDTGYPGYRGTLGRDCVTIAEVLKASGYRTMMTGKWHVGTLEGTWPVDRGFERYFGIIRGRATSSNPSPTSS